MAVALRVIVVRVDDNFARERRNGDQTIVYKRNGDYDNVPSLGGIARRCRSRPVP